MFIIIKYIKNTAITYLVVSVIITAVPWAGSISSAMAPGTAVNNVRLVIDSENKQEFPKHFRKASDELKTNDEKVNLAGLNTMKISGSHQFSEKGLVLVKEAIGSNMPIIIVDLRQESHGFINGAAVSWANENNNANEGLTKGQVLLDEDKKLQSIPLNQPISIYNNGHIEIVPIKVENERNLTQSHGMSYVRIPVTDGRIPTDDMVDFFVDFIKSQPENVWIHFHCRAGVGRTTMFMIMYDMMKNSKQISPDDIIKRQILLANLSPKSTESFYTDERMDFLKNFYKYCRENSGNFSTAWSKWITLQ